MAVVTRAFNPADCFQGPGDLWLDVAAPPSAVPPVQYTNTLTLDSAGAPNDTGSSGIHLGLTDGPCVASIAPKFTEIKADQFAAPIDVALVSLACEIDFTIKEINLTKMPKYFAGIAVGNYHDVTIGSTNPAADMLQVGSQVTSTANFRTVLLVSPRRDSLGKFLYVFAYRAYVASSIAMQFDRKKDTVIKIKMKCVADPARVAKDQVLQVVRTT